MRSACLGGSLAILTTVAAAGAEPDRFLVVQAGDLPVILTAPHGGRETIPDVPPRTRGTTTRDVATLEITQAVAARIAEILGRAPYLVAARFTRKQIDANRAEAEAIEHDAARPIYQAYHAQIRRFAAETRARFPAGALLIDVHGQSTLPLAIVRGTRDGATVPRLLARDGVAALTGPASILGVLAGRGYAIVPPNTASDVLTGVGREPSAYRGGFTVRTYGADPADGIDALQLELGKDVRTRAELVDDLAHAIATFTRTHLGGVP